MSVQELLATSRQWRHIKSDTPFIPLLPDYSSSNFLVLRSLTVGVAGVVLELGSWKHNRVSNIATVSGCNRRRHNIRDKRQDYSAGNSLLDMAFCAELIP